MKTETNIAMSYLYSVDNLLCNKPIKLDMRYNSSRRIKLLIKQNQLSEQQKTLIIQLKRIRAINKPKPFTNILQNKLVIDYISNRNYIKRIEEDRIVFFGNRNHWAKNEQDVRVLSILKKYF